MAELQSLAALLRQWNAIGDQIARLIGRPANFGHIGEYVAAAIFDIQLEESASQKGIDGHFRSGSLAGTSVNIKYTAKNDGLLNMTLDGAPDYYLVLAGPKTPPVSSRGMTRPWVISNVYLFRSELLVADLTTRSQSKGRKVKIGIATSVPNEFWQSAELYPESRSRVMNLSDEHHQQLALFDPLA